MAENRTAGTLDAPERTAMASDPGGTAHAAAFPPWIRALNTPQAATIPVLALQIVLIAGADWLTGTQFDFSVFYALPVLLATWRRGSAGAGLSIGIATLAWILDLVLGGALARGTAPLFWNLAVRVAFLTCLALLVFGLKRQAESLHRAERERAEALTAKAEALAAKAEAEAQAHETALQAARSIQRGLFPAWEPKDTSLQVAGDCQPMEEVGGDLYDWLDLPGGATALVIGDVVDHGLPAALFMAALSGALRARLAAAGAESMAAIMTAVNNQVCGFATEGDFATLCACRIDRDWGRIEWANAGHPPPLILRSGGGIEKLTVTGPALGLQCDAPFRLGSAPFRVGDRIILYTDGITEAFSPAEECYGDQRLEQSLLAGSSLDAKSLAAHILEDVDRFADGAGLSDDRTLVVARALERPSPAPTMLRSEP